MCFSAGASFGAGAILGVAGALSVKKIKKASQLPFAAIPVLFGLQQICEGMLWLSLTHGAYSSWQAPMTHVFLCFAQVIWPLWVPLSFALLENNSTRKKLLNGTLVIGIITSCLLAYRLIVCPVSAEIRAHHIYYSIVSSRSLIISSSILYFIAIIIPPFISGVKGMRLLGLILFVSLLATEIFYRGYLISVWCFFAAILSVMIICIMKRHVAARGIGPEDGRYERHS